MIRVISGRIIVKNPAQKRKIDTITRTKRVRCTCGTEFHYKDLNKIWERLDFKTFKLSRCPECSLGSKDFSYWSKHPHFRYYGLQYYQYKSILRKELGVRKVRNDEQSIAHKREVTRNRVRRWRQKRRGGD